eukprot:9692374-Alexandrium_andersonii.AAC.1
MGLGSSADAVVAGDMNELPQESDISYWAAKAGWGGLFPIQPTRWRSERVIDWGVFREHAARGRAWTEESTAISDHKMV